MIDVLSTLRFASIYTNKIFEVFVDRLSIVRSFITFSIQGLFCILLDKYSDRKMESDVTLTNDWVYRRFFLSNIRSAPRLFCCNTPNGFTFGQINLDVSRQS